jgi:hypothetical protein
MIGVDRVAEKMGRRCPALGLSCGPTSVRSDEREGRVRTMEDHRLLCESLIISISSAFLGGHNQDSSRSYNIVASTVPYVWTMPSENSQLRALQASKIIGICETACCSTDPRQSVVCHVYITVNNRYLLMKMLFSRPHHHFPKFPLASSNFSPSSYQRSLIVPAPSRATESQHAQRHLHRELYLLYLLSRGVRQDPLHPLHLTGMDCILAFSASSSYVSVVYPIPHMGLSSWNVRWTGSRNRGIRRSGPASLRCIRPEHLYNLLHRYHHRSGILLGVDLPESCANHPSLRRRSHAFRSSNNHFCVHVLRLRLASSSRLLVVR